MMRYIPSISSYSRFVIMGEYWILLNDFFWFCFYDKKWYLFFIQLKCFVLLSGFHLLNYHASLGWILLDHSNNLFCLIFICFGVLCCHLFICFYTLPRTFFISMTSAIRTSLSFHNKMKITTHLLSSQMHDLFVNYLYCCHKYTCTHVYIHKCIYNLLSSFKFSSFNFPHAYMPRADLPLYWKTYVVACS